MASHDGMGSSRAGCLSVNPVTKWKKSLCLFPCRLAVVIPARASRRGFAEAGSPFMLSPLTSAAQNGADPRCRCPDVAPSLQCSCPPLCLRARPPWASWPRTGWAPTWATCWAARWAASCCLTAASWWGEGRGEGGPCWRRSGAHRSGVRRTGWGVHTAAGFSAVRSTDLDIQTATSRCTLLAPCLQPQFTNAINAISVAKVSYPFKEVRGARQAGHACAWHARQAGTC